MPSKESLAADRLYNDPRVAEAKQLLMAAVADHQKDLTEVRGPDPALTAEYQALLEAVREAPRWQHFLSISWKWHR